MWSAKRVSVSFFRPWTALFRNSGLSHPRALIKACICFSEACCPSSRVARSRGGKATSKRKKVMTQTPSTSGMV